MFLPLKLFVQVSFNWISSNLSLSKLWIMKTLNNWKLTK